MLIYKINTNGLNLLNNIKNGVKIIIKLKKLLNICKIFNLLKKNYQSNNKYIYIQILLKSI